VCRDVARLAAVVVLDDLAHLARSEGPSGSVAVARVVVREGNSGARSPRTTVTRPRDVTHRAWVGIHNKGTTHR
jgi:hypothetical protein